MGRFGSFGFAIATDSKETVDRSKEPFFFFNFSIAQGLSTAIVGAK